MRVEAVGPVPTWYVTAPAWYSAWWTLYPPGRPRWRALRLGACAADAPPRTADSVYSACADKHAPQSRAYPTEATAWPSWIDTTARLRAVAPPRKFELWWPSDEYPPPEPIVRVKERKTPTPPADKATGRPLNLLW